MTKLTLLDKALATPMRKNYGRSASKEEIELGLAWMQGYITITQVGKAMGITAGLAQSRMAKILRDAYLSGKLEVKDGE